MKEEHLVKLLSTKKIGRKTAFKIANMLGTGQGISDDNDYRDFVLEAVSNLKVATTTADINDGIQKGQNIIDNGQKKNVKLVGFFSSMFPAQLKGIVDPPILLSVIGDIKPLIQETGIAIIGTREPSDFGMKVGLRVGEYFGNRGYPVVSGLAVGCDTAGHRGCLKGGGYTCAVLAHGLNTIYPKENAPLAEEIVDSGGCLVSEYLYGQGSMPQFFVERDRIQAGLSGVVLVIETGVKGGTMHTVKYAQKFGRLVAAIKHDERYANHEKAAGNRMIIGKMGGTPVGSHEDYQILIDSLSRQNSSMMPIDKPVPYHKPGMQGELQL